MFNGRTRVLIALSHLCLAACVSAQDAPAAPSQPAQAAPPETRPPQDPGRISDAASKAVALLLARQESLDAKQPDRKAEWPYEGVYRVRREIPIGYRVGGTAIVSTALLRAPGYAGDEARKQAIARAAVFICEQTAHPLMSFENYDGGYDVRGWGYTYALAFLLELKGAKAIPTEPPELAEKIESTIRWCIDGIQKTEIKDVGGWNYARGPGRDAVSPCSPFMTGPTLQALFDAKAKGYAVDDGVIARALAALDRCRGMTGSFAYSAKSEQNPQRPEPVPGSVGRMLAGETTLFLAGKSDLARVRGALDAFFTHWDWLDQRRAKTGTHEGPYGVAPYYFYFAHYSAAQAIELLPRADRAEYRRRLAKLMFSVQNDDGSWNDRVFPRSSSYGTAMAIMALQMNAAPSAPRYQPPAAAPDANP